MNWQGVVSMFQSMNWQAIVLLILAIIVIVYVVRYTLAVLILTSVFADGPEARLARWILAAVFIGAPLVYLILNAKWH